MLEMGSVPTPHHGWRGSVASKQLVVYCQLRQSTWSSSSAGARLCPGISTEALSTMYPLLGHKCHFGFEVTVNLRACCDSSVRSSCLTASSCNASFWAAAGSMPASFCRLVIFWTSNCFAFFRACAPVEKYITEHIKSTYTGMQPNRAVSTDTYQDWGISHQSVRFGILA